MKAKDDVTNSARITSNLYILYFIFSQRLGILGRYIVKARIKSVYKNEPVD